MAGFASRGSVSRVLVSVAVGTLAAAILIATGLSAGLERPAIDARARLFAAPGAASGRIGLVYVDQYSLDWAEANLGVSWPWPRELYGLITDYCAAADAVVFDIVFTEASAYGPEDDARFAEALKRSGHAALASSPETDSVIPPDAAIFGSAAADPDPDGVVRRYRAESSATTGSGFSLGMAAAVAGGNAAGASTAAGGADRAGSWVRGDTRWLRYRGTSPAYEAWNAAELLSGALAQRAGKDAALDPERFARKTIFVGLSAPGLLDRMPTPVDPAMPGAEIHATFLDNYLSGDFLNAPEPWMELAFAALAALAAAVALLPAKKPALQVCGAVAALAVSPALALLLYPSGFLFPVAATSVAAVVSLATGLGLAYAAEGKQKAFIKGAFGQYLAPEVIETLLKNPASLRLGGDRRTLTVLFSDVQGFTALSERIEPEALTAFMNEYLGIVTKAVLDEGGTIDKYIGDAVMAFWNAPTEQADHAIRAVRAAVAAQKALACATPDLERLCGTKPVTRMGLHTGEAIAGNMGSDFRFGYTALGDAVNLASRLEGANKPLGTRILASRATVQAAGLGEYRKAAGGASTAGAAAEKPEARRLGFLKVLGREAPVEVWEIRFDGNAGPLSAVQWDGIRVLDSK
ncbi:MAG: adenylate/guanylate cyclase domain-containing protein [Rectinemataceae bacterium]